LELRIPFDQRLAHVSPERGRRIPDLGGAPRSPALAVVLFAPLIPPSRVLGVPSPRTGDAIQPVIALPETTLVVRAWRELRIKESGDEEELLEAGLDPLDLRHCVRGDPGDRSKRG
jgi:hypothetical protein